MSNEHLLREGLVGRHVELYRTNANFKVWIDHMVLSLPIWVNAMAEETTAIEARMNDIRQMHERVPLMSRDKALQMLGLCPQCETKVDEHGYCTDPGCVNVGKVPER